MEIGDNSMAHFAEIDSSNNKVIRTVVVSDADIAANGGNNSIQAEEWVKNNILPDPIVKEQFFNGVYPQTYWKQTYKDRSFRKNYATQNYTWDEAKQIFISPKPASTWVLNENNDWQPPIPWCYNKSEGTINWDDANIRWITSDGTKYYDFPTDSWIAI